MMDVPQNEPRPGDDETPELNYRNLCPGSDPEKFHLEALAMTAFFNKGEGKLRNKKTVNRQLDQIRNAIKKLSPDVRELIKDREVMAIVQNLVALGHDPDDAKRDGSIAGVKYDKKSAIDKLEALVEDKYEKHKINTNREKLAYGAAALWRRHGGVVTTTESRTGFVMLLDQMMGNIGLDHDAVRLIRDFDLHKIK